MIGKKLSPVLEEIEFTLWEFEAHSESQPKYTHDGFKAGIKIFMSVLMDKIWDLQESEDIEMQDRLDMVQKAGEDIRSLVKTYTDIDCHKLYK